MNLFYSLALVLSMSSATQIAQAQESKPLDYTAAYHLAQKGDKPLLVLVTAQWCAPCQSLKKSTLPEMKAINGFSSFHFATVDVDQDPTTAEKLTENRPVPQFIIFEKNGDKWRKRYSIGYLGTKDLQAFLAPSIPQTLRMAASDPTNR